MRDTAEAPALNIRIKKGLGHVQDIYITLGFLGRIPVVSESARKKLVCVSSLDCLIGWRFFLFELRPRAGRDGEKEGDLRMVVNHYQPRMVGFRVVACYQQVMPNDRRRAGMA